MLVSAKEWTVSIPTEKTVKIRACLNRKEIIMNCHEVNSAPYFGTVEGYTKKTLWKLYHLAPPIAYFSIQVLEESADTILDSLMFSKNNEAEKRSGEMQLPTLIRKIGHISFGYPRITCELKYGFGCDCIVKVYISD